MKTLHYAMRLIFTLIILNILMDSCSIELISATVSSSNEKAKYISANHMAGKRALLIKIIATQKSVVSQSLNLIMKTLYWILFYLNGWKYLQHAKNVGKP